MIKIQKAKVTDILEIKEILRESWNERYKKIFTSLQIENITSEWHNIERLKKQIEDPNIIFLVIKDGDKTIAMCNTDTIQDDHINIQRIHVRPGYQRQGIGTKLIEQIIKSFPHTKKLDLEVEKHNTRAMSFYLKHGFKKVGTKDFEVASCKIRCFVMEKIL